MARKPKDPNSPWLKRVLIPFWVVQSLLDIFLFAGAIIDLVDGDFVANIVVVLIFSSICIILVITEIFLFARRRLKPLTYLVFQCVKTGLWLVMFVVATINGLGKQASGSTAGVSEHDLTTGLVETAVLFFAHLGSLIYGGVVLHRKRLSRRRRPVSGATINDRYNQGPYQETGTTTADYARLNSQVAPRNGGVGSPTVTGSEPTPGLGGAFESGGHQTYTGPYESGWINPRPYESDGKTIEGRAVELGSIGGNVSSAELPAKQADAYELAASKSIKGGYYQHAPSPKEGRTWSWDPSPAVGPGQKRHL